MSCRIGRCWRWTSSKACKVYLLDWSLPGCVLSDRNVKRDSHQGQAAQKDHGNNGSLEIFVLDQMERLQSQVCPALPERSIIVAGQEWKLLVAILRTAVGGVIRFNRIVVRVYDLAVEFLPFFAFIFQIWKIICLITRETASIFCTRMCNRCSLWFGIFTKFCKIKSLGLPSSCSRSSLLASFFSSPFSESMLPLWLSSLNARFLWLP